MIDCPHCFKSLGGPSSDGGVKIRLGITLVDDQTGRVHGPCPFFKADVTVAEGAELSKALTSPTPKPPKRRRYVRIGFPKS